MSDNDWYAAHAEGCLCTLCDPNPIGEPDSRPAKAPPTAPDPSELPTPPPGLNTQPRGGEGAWLASWWDEQARCLGPVGRWGVADHLGWRMVHAYGGLAGRQRWPWLCTE